MENRYRSAADLGIEGWERDGLIALVGPLGRGDLSVEMCRCGCDTVHCIGGWLYSLADVRPPCSMGRYVCHEKSDALKALFFPDDNDYRDAGGWLADARQASRAIVNFLLTGDPQWESVMEEGQIRKPV